MPFLSVLIYICLKIIGLLPDSDRNMPPSCWSAVWQARAWTVTSIYHRKRTFTIDGCAGTGSVVRCSYIKTSPAACRRWFISVSVMHSILTGLCSLGTFVPWFQKKFQAVKWQRRKGGGFGQYSRLWVFSGSAAAFTRIIAASLSAGYNERKEGSNNRGGIYMESGNSGYRKHKKTC